MCTEDPSFRLLRGVYFSVRARAVKIESGAPRAVPESNGCDGSVSATLTPSSVELGHTRLLTFLSQSEASARVITDQSVRP